jgi:tight adherence protein B
MDSMAAIAPRVVASMAFVAVVLLLAGAWLLWRGWRGPAAVKLARRLQALAGTGPSESASIARVHRGDLQPSGGGVGADRAARAVQRLLLQAGVRWNPGATLLLSICLAGTPLLLALWLRGRRLERLQRQLPDALDLIARALRSGHALSAAFAMAAEELAEPIAGEFRALSEEIGFGVPLERAPEHLASRVPLTDLRYLVVAVLVQRDSGGNLTELLDNLGRLVRERLKFAGQVRVLASEGRLSAWILGLMPFVLAGLMTVINPGFMTLLWTDPLGVAILRLLLGLMVAGFLILNRVTRIRA